MVRGSGLATHYNREAFPRILLTPFFATRTVRLLDKTLVAKADLPLETRPDAAGSVALRDEAFVAQPRRDCV